MRTAVVIALACALAGCVTAPTREDVSAFKVIREGNVPSAAVQPFANCLLDGFSRAHWVLTNIAVSQQVRGTFQRIETRTGARMLLVSADVHNDGRVQLLESSTAALINTAGEREAFDRCLEQWRSAPSS